MRHKWLIIVLIAVAVLGLAFFAGIISFFISSAGSAKFSAEGGFSSSVFAGKQIGVITVEGMISSSDEIVKQIEEARKDDDIASVIMRIESPGGSIGASQEIFEAIKQLAEKKPVIASMGSVAASGGYYIACGATKILANPGTITGSIGVRLEHVTLGELLKWAKVGHETLKSGRYKDIGSFDRPITPEERAILEGVLRDLHDQFKEVVAKTRNLPADKVDKIADGRVYTGREARDLGLVDEMGGFTEAIKIAGKLGNISGEPKLSYSKKKGYFIFKFIDGMKSLFAEVSHIPPLLADYWQPMMSIAEPFVFQK